MAGSNPLYLSSSSCLRCSSLSFYSKTSVVSLRAFPKTPLRLTFPRIVAFSSNDIKVGSNVEVDGAPWRVLEFLHVKPGKGAAFVRTKMRNYVTGNTVEKTFRAGSTLTEANILKETKQYTYKDGSQFVFMDLSTYEESCLNDADIGDKKKWLKEGLDCNLLFWNGKRDTTALNAENTELKIRLQSMEQAQLQDALNEALKQEVQRLKVATGQVNSSSETFNSFGHSLDYNTSFFTLVPQKGPTINPPHPITLPNSSTSSNHKLHPPSKNVSGTTQQDQLDQFEGLDIGNGNVLHIVKSESSSISASGSSNTF